MNLYKSENTQRSSQHPQEDHRMFLFQLNIYVQFLFHCFKGELKEDHSLLFDVATLYKVNVALRIMPPPLPAELKHVSYHNTDLQ